jgi:hypothetical protein
MIGDSKPKGTSTMKQGKRILRDQSARSDYLAALSHPSTSEMGDDPDPLAAGARIVMVLPGPSSSYTIETLGDGRAALVQHANVDGELDPGKTMTGERGFESGIITDTRRLMHDRAAASQARMEEIAAQHRDFWQRQQRHG